MNKHYKKTVFIFSVIILHGIYTSLRVNCIIKNKDGLLTFTSNTDYSKQPNKLRKVLHKSLWRTLYIRFQYIKLSNYTQNDPPTLNAEIVYWEPPLSGEFFGINVKVHSEQFYVVRMEDFHMFVSYLPEAYEKYNK